MSHSGVRVAIVDQHEVVRVGVRGVLERRLLVQVAGEAASCLDGVALCRDLQPDVVVAGLPLRGATGLEHVTAFRAESPRTAVVILTDIEDPQTVLEAVRAGAAAYLLSDGTATELATAIDRVVAGETVIDPRLLTGVIRSVAARAGEPWVTTPAPLTPRELQVLREIARGSANKEIARDLRVAAGTVKIHVERILHKLGAANRADASIRAMRMGLLDGDAIDRIPIGAAEQPPAQDATTP